MPSPTFRIAIAFTLAATPFNAFADAQQHCPRENAELIEDLAMLKIVQAAIDDLEKVHTPESAKKEEIK